MEKQEKTRYMAKLWTGAGKQWKVESKTQLFQYWEKYKGKMTAIGRNTCLCTTNFLNFYIWTFFAKLKDVFHNSILRWRTIIYMEKIEVQSD